MRERSKFFNNNHFRFSDAPYIRRLLIVKVVICQQLTKSTRFQGIIRSLHECKETPVVFFLFFCLKIELSVNFAPTLHEIIVLVFTVNISPSLCLAYFFMSFYVFFFLFFVCVCTFAVFILYNNCDCV